MGSKKKATAEKAASKKRESEAAAEPKKGKKKAKKAAEEEEQPVAAVEEPEVVEVEDEEDDEEAFSDGEDDEGEEDEDEEPTAIEIWQDQLKERADAMDKFVVLYKTEESENEGDEDEEDDEEDKEVTVERLEKMTRMFLPKQAEPFLIQVSEALADIGFTDEENDEEPDDDDEEKPPAEKELHKQLMRMFRVRGLCTRHSDPMQAIIKDSLKEADKAIKKKDWKLGFCHWIATLLSVNDESHWFADTESPEEVVAIYKQLKKQWDTLKKRSDKDLGDPVAEGPNNPTPRQVMDKMLQKLAGDLADAEYTLD